MSDASAPIADAVIWHDVECGGYVDDLRLYEELAEAADGPVLEIGCGTGRVALHLADRGYAVLGIDTDAELVAALNERAAAAGIGVRGVVADGTRFELDRRFPLVIAPMQVVQILGGIAPREAMLARAAAHLQPGGRLAVAIVTAGHFSSAEAGTDAPPPLPDVRERDTWVYSSLPLDISLDDDRIEIKRLHQVVAPGGGLTEEVDITTLDALSPETLATEAASAGLRHIDTREIPTSERYIGSAVCILERP